MSDLNIEQMYEIVNEIKTEQVRMAEQLSNYQKLIETVQNIALAVRDLANAQNNTSEEVKKLRSDVDDIKSKPAKKLDAIQMFIIGAIITGIVGFFAGKLFA